MLNQIGSIFLLESRLDKYKKLFNKVFIAGILVLIFFPLLAKKVTIIEKFYMNSAQISLQLTIQEFQNYYMEYMNSQNNDESNDLLNFAKSPFLNLEWRKHPNEILTKNFNSLRGAKRKFMIINLIIDPKDPSKINEAYKANAMFYVLMKFLTDKEKITWLAKDVQINYVSYDLFFNNPKEGVEHIIGQKNKKIESGQSIEGIFNIDLNNFDIENVHQILLGINGLNAECLDLDIYGFFEATFEHIFESQNLVTNTRKVIKEPVKGYLKSIFSSLGQMVSVILPKYGGKTFVNGYFNMLNNLLYNYLLVDNNVNLNHFLITENHNSILFQVIPTKDENINNDQNLYAIKFRNNYYFIGCLIRFIKIFSKNEIDNFRGEFFYILTDSSQYIDYKHLIPAIMLVIRGFYEVINCIYRIEYIHIGDEDPKTNLKPSKIICYLTFILIVIFGLIINIQHLHSYFGFPIGKNYNQTYSMLILIITVFGFICFYLMKMNKNSEIFIESVLRITVLVNTWNFFTYNIAIGYFMYIFLLPLDYLQIQLNENPKKNKILLTVISVELWLFLSYGKLINTMVSNFINYRNNVYFLLTLSLVHLCLRYSIILNSFIKELKNKSN